MLSVGASPTLEWHSARSVCFHEDLLPVTANATVISSWLRKLEEYSISGLNYFRANEALISIKIQLQAQDFELIPLLVLFLFKIQAI